MKLTVNDDAITTEATTVKGLRRFSGRFLLAPPSPWMGMLCRSRSGARTR